MPSPVPLELNSARLGNSIVNLCGSPQDSKFALFQRDLFWSLRCCAGLIAALCLAPAASAADRWVGRLANGEVVRAAEITEWNDPKSNPQLAGRVLLDPGNPVLQLLDTQATSVVQPTTFVEFFGGDRLAGEVVGAGNGNESPFETLPPHLLLRPSADYQPPDYASDQPLRIASKWIRRIAWNGMPGRRYAASTAWLSGGGQVVFRSLRWNISGVTLLTDSGLRTFSYSDLAEIHLPRQEEWSVYVDQVAALSPRLSSKLVQLELLDGSRLTTSMERLQPRHWGDKKLPASWLQIVQPAWALEALWVRFPAVIGWSWFDPAEPPLSWCDPIRVERQSVFGGSWQWHRDRSSLGGRLVVANEFYQRGFGVHGSTDLTFALPPFAREIRTRCGLDHAAGVGGCVKLSIVAGDGHEQFATDPLIGSTRLLDSNWLPVASTSPDLPPTVTFRSDMLAKDPPRGTDPFDILDVVDWVEPQVRLDRDQLLARIGGGAADRVAGLQGWKFIHPDESFIETRNWLDDTESRAPQFRQLWSSTRPYVLLTRSLKVAAADRWVSLIASRFEKSSSPTLLQLKIDGRSAGEFELPLRQGPIDPMPLSVPLAPGPARTVQLEVTVYPPAPDSWWDWRGVIATPDLPGIKTLYDETTTEFHADPAGHQLHPDGAAPFAGRQSLRVEPGRVDIPQVDALTSSIVDLPRLGQYRFLTFAWKGTETPGLALWLSHEGRIGPEIASGFGLGPLAGRGARPGISRQRRLEDRGLKYGFAYDIGTYKQAEGAPLRLDKKTPADWRFETRDVVGDFGAITLTGFGFECVGSGSGWFDAIALARTPEDLEVLKRRYGPAAKPNQDATYAQIAARREDWGPAIAEFAPQFATPLAQHGIYQKREHQGQAGGWQTHPNDRDKPFILRTGRQFPADRPQELDILVSNQPASDFKLMVRVDGETIYEQIINDALTGPQRGFASVQVDLSKFQGQTVLLEVLNASNDWSNEHAIWKRVHLRDRSTP